MRDFIPIAKPIIGDEEIKAVGEVLRSGMLAQGESVKRFEDEFSSYLGVKNSIAVNNGTVALDLAIKALGLKPGDEVITPAFTFIATANCVLYQGLRPVFADVDARTFNIDPDDLQKKNNTPHQGRDRRSPLRPALRPEGGTGRSARITILLW